MVLMGKFKCDAGQQQWEPFINNASDNPPTASKEKEPTGENEGTK